jgi:hypothetical protein
MAERSFDLAGKPGEHATIRIRKPARDSKTGSYKCSVEWIRPEEEELFELWGIDSMQALQLAIRAAGELTRLYEDTLRWSGGDDGYLGFPKSYPEQLPKGLLRKLDRMIEREIRAHTQKLETEAKRQQHHQHQAAGRTRRRRLS